MSSLSIYGSHDSSFCFGIKDNKYKIYELERLTKKRYDRFNVSDEAFKESCKKIFDIINKYHRITTFDKCYYSQLSLGQVQIIKDTFNVSSFKEVGHHLSHAASTLYQSPFDESLIISFDGGGFDEDGVSTFNIYHGKKQTNQINRLAKILSKRTIEDQEKDGYPSKNLPLDLGNVYSLFAVPIKEIRKDENWQKNFLAFAGKIMGLVAYGNPREEWLEPIERFYYKSFYSGKLDILGKLGEEIGLNLGVNTIEGKDAYDLAATSQKVFEEIFLKEVSPYVEQYNLPICLTGGCALNVLLNERLRTLWDKKIYISPNPSDCGLSLGMLLINEPPNVPIVDVTYNGAPILDFENLDHYVAKYNASEVSLETIANKLAEGKIIGFMKRDSECGPRALGNRSILADPSFPKMKDVLNDKVKHREWFRPFAPMVRKQDVNEFFEFDGESPYMSFAPKVKKKWINKIPAIVHADGTARVQTVTLEQNDSMYNLLGEMEKIKGYGVLLNTSFNIKGNPILTTIEDAIHVLISTEMDCLIVEEPIVKEILHKLYIPTPTMVFDAELGKEVEKEMIIYEEKIEIKRYSKYFMFYKKRT